MSGVSVGTPAYVYARNVQPPSGHFFRHSGLRDLRRVLRVVVVGDRPAFRRARRARRPRPPCRSRSSRPPSRRRSRRHARSPFSVTVFGVPTPPGVSRHPSSSVGSSRRVAIEARCRARAPASAAATNVQHAFTVRGACTRWGSRSAEIVQRLAEVGLRERRAGSRTSCRRPALTPPPSASGRACCSSCRRRRSASESRREEEGRQRASATSWRAFIAEGASRRAGSRERPCSVP